MTSNQSTDQQHHDDHFERHLREFRLVTPRPLAIPRHRAPWTALAVAAVLLLAAGAWFFTPPGRPSTVQLPFAHAPLTMGRLNAALGDNDEAFNRLLDDASPAILPHSQQGTVLYELGKE